MRPAGPLKRWAGAEAGGVSTRARALPAAPARESGGRPFGSSPGPEKEGGPSPAGGAGRGEAGAAYVRRAAGGMKGAESGSRPAPSPLPAPDPGAHGSPDLPWGRWRGRPPAEAVRARSQGGGRPGGAGGGDVATAQAGGARPRREAEPPGEEAPSGPGAAAGGSGNAGSGACPGERGPPARPPGPPLGW